MANFISEDDIEQALLEKLNRKLGFELLNCYTKDPNDLQDRSLRQDKKDVIFRDRLTAACTRLNPGIPSQEIDRVVDRVTNRRGAMSSIAANRELNELIRDGVPVEFEDERGIKQNETVRLIDFNDSKNNQYLAVSQLWIKSTSQAAKTGYRRPDVILYINGLPLVFIELKNSNVKLKTAFDDNLTNYKNDIPQLFHCNAFCILSNAIETKVGSFTAGWEHFFNWLRVNDEKEKVDRHKIREEGTSLEYVLKGLCQPTKLLDYVENFIVFHQQNKKIIAQNHQFIGVNNAYQRFLERDKYDGKLGVFWHTQGSGKSFSMIFYTRKIFRKLTGNFTFVVVTDRDDLDGQIYKNFLDTGTVKKNEIAQPKNSEELRKYLRQNKRIVFTLIQKFRYDKGKEYPHLIEDKDREIIVIVDEAHRTQYKSLAENMRKGLKGAYFIAFTGTPLLGRDRKTNKWFGDYVSEYNFQQAMDDGATVPLFYKKRVPEVLIQNDDLSEEFYELVEDENLDEAQQTKLEKKFAREMEVIKRDDRLETIAKDIVYHFPRRGYLGKGIVIAVDKFTALKLYDKVQHHWKQEIRQLKGLINNSNNEVEKAKFKKIIAYMRQVEMAVVISDARSDIDKFQKKGLNLKPHAERLEAIDENGHDIEYNFKDANHPLQLVFVCAMWLTGFDAPTVSTLYLDKPMKDHSLMQAIARANRVSSYQIAGVTKKNGEIVDYYNVFRNMKKALKDYARGDDGQNAPVREKEKLFNLLDNAISQATEFCLQRNIDLDEIVLENEPLKNISKFKEYADILLSKDDWRKAFNVYQNTILSLYEACKPEILSQPPRQKIFIIQYLRGVIDSIIQQTDLDEVTQKISELLDESVVVNNAEIFTDRDHSLEYQIVQTDKTWDLSKIDFDRLQEDFGKANYKNIEIANLRAFIERKIEQMLRQNLNRIDFAQKLQQIVERYNAGASSTENYFEDLMRFTEEMKAEDERHIREGLTEDELELFDTIKKDKLNQEEKQKVKLAAKSLLHRLIEEHPKVLVQDWWKDSQTQQAVKNAVEEVLDNNLPDSYDRKLFKKACDNVFDLVVEFASKRHKWAV